MRTAASKTAPIAAASAGTPAARAAGVERIIYLGGPVPEGAPLSVRRTRAGDAWESRNAAPVVKPVGVMLGLPTIGAPAPVAAAASGCGCD